MRAFDLGGRATASLLPEEGMRRGFRRGDRRTWRSDGLETGPYRGSELPTCHGRCARGRAGPRRPSPTPPPGSATPGEDAETARDLAEVALRDARAALADATLTAPFDALVAARLNPAAEHGWSPASRSCACTTCRKVRVEIDLPERVFVSAGGLDRVGFAARTPQGVELPLAPLVAFRPDTSRVGQTYLVTLAFLSDPGAALLPGASATVTATFPNDTPGVAVPAQLRPRWQTTGPPRSSCWRDRARPRPCGRACR